MISTASCLYGQSAHEERQPRANPKKQRMRPPPVAKQTRKCITSTRQCIFQLDTAQTMLLSRFCFPHRRELEARRVVGVEPKELVLPRIPAPEAPKSPAESAGACVR